MNSDTAFLNQQKGVFYELNISMPDRDISMNNLISDQGR
jgi:hypothetical protein